MSLENVPGQPRARRFLRQLLRSGHVPHALLFTGIAGIGKAAMARGMAKVLNCLDPPDLDCCDACISCRKIDADNHPDVSWVSSQGVFIKLDQIRALKDQVRFRPFEGKWRVTIIADAQNLKEEAGNALLKLLEEPPGQNLFILLALEPQMLLQTIVSRCCHIRFQPLEDDWIMRHLVESHGMEPTRARDVARLAGGSLDRARWWTEADRVSRRREIIQRVRGLRDLSMFEFFPRMAQWVQESEDLEQDMECIKLWVRDLILSRLMEERRAGLLEPDCADTGDSVPEIPVMKLFLLYDQVELAMRHLRQNANKQLTVEGVCLAVKDILYGQGRQSSRDSLSRGR